MDVKYGVTRARLVRRYSCTLCCIPYSTVHFLPSLLARATFVWATFSYARALIHDVLYQTAR